MHQYLLVLLIFIAKMKKWFKIIISGLIVFLIYGIGYSSIVKGNKTYPNEIMYWVYLVLIVFTITTPILSHWWKRVNKWLWKIESQNYSRDEVRILFKEFIAEVGQNKIKNYDEFNQWLKDKDLL